MKGRILYITPTSLPTVGGAEIFLDKLLKGTSTNFDWSDVIAPGYAADVDVQNVRVHRVRTIPLISNWSFFLHSALSLLYFLILRRPRIVHFNMLGTTALLGVFMSRLFGVPTVITIHGADFRKLEAGGFLSRLKELAMGRCSAVVVVSKFEFDDLRQKFKDNLYFIPTGVDTHFFRPSSRKKEKDKIDLLFVGNIRREKGVDILLEALALLRDSEPELEFSLKIAGKDEKNTVRELSRDLGLSDRIEMLGSVSHETLPGVYRGGDLFLMPSRAEALSLSLLEAMASGLPIIASNIPGNRSVLTDHENGILVEPGDARALADAILKLVNSPELAGKIGQKARLDAESYDWKKITKKYLELYDKVGL